MTPSPTAPATSRPERASGSRTLEHWHELAQQLRVDSVRAAAAAGSGHPTSAMSAADLMAVLLAGHLHYDFAAPEDPRNDRLIFSKGHASPLLYAMYKAAGAVTDQELLTFRKLHSRLQGHPTPAIPWVDVASGSLGFGLAAGVGIALAARRLDRLPYRVWVLCGDGETAEGAVWEAVDHAAHEHLDNLIAIIDVNRLGQHGETMLGWNLDEYAARLRAFGWRALEVDGHDIAQIDSAYKVACSLSARPVAIVARTVKGKGVAAVENRNGFHGRPLPDPEAAVGELGGQRNLHVAVHKPSGPNRVHRFPTSRMAPPTWPVGGQVATRRAYGEALTALASRDGRIVALDGEVGNSTYAELFAQRHPERYFEMYISEQQLVAAAVGMQARGWVPIASTFAAFFARAYDFVRMAAISGADLRLVGSHAGVSIGEDGPSQMGLEDMATMRAVCGSTVLYPCCANQTASLVAAMAERPGIVYLRTTRGATPVLYEPGEEFAIGGSRTARAVDGYADVTVVAAGITVHEALAAAKDAAAKDVKVRVIDLYSVKPADAQALQTAAASSGALLTVEDHFAQGGLAAAVREVFAENDARPKVKSLAVRGMPSSGTPQELLAQAGIDRASIAGAIRALAGSTRVFSP
jgi:transketolase